MIETASKLTARFQAFVGQSSGYEKTYWILHSLLHLFHLVVACFIPKTFALVCRRKIVGNTQFWTACFLREGNPKFFTSIFKYASLPNTWQSLIEFYSVTSMWKKKVRKRSEGRSKLTKRSLPFVDRSSPNFKETSVTLCCLFSSSPFVSSSFPHENIYA